MNDRFPIMLIIVAFAGGGGEGAGHHMWHKMLIENEVDTMQDAAMNMKKYLQEEASQHIMETLVGNCENSTDLRLRLPTQLFTQTQ